MIGTLITAHDFIKGIFKRIPTVNFTLVNPHNNNLHLLQRKGIFLVIRKGENPKKNNGQASQCLKNH